MVVRVDEPRDDQPIGRVDRLGTRDDQVTPYFGDRTVLIRRLFVLGIFRSFPNSLLYRTGPGVCLTIVR